MIDEIDPVLLNKPVLIEHRGSPQLYVFPDIEGGQCTGQTKRGDRCRNHTWDQGQMAPFGKTSVGAYTVEHYGPLPSGVARVYLMQRCRVHATPDAAAYCNVEWERFDVQRHAHFLYEPRLSDFVDTLIARRSPTVESLGRALCAEYGALERQRLAKILLAEQPTEDAE